MAGRVLAEMPPETPYMTSNSRLAADQTPLMKGSLKIDSHQSSQIKMQGISINRPGFLDNENGQPNNQ
jgi:hypothetical protein